MRAHSVCRPLMTAPGVGALVSLAFKVAVDDPRRFSRSRDVGAQFGLTPREHNSDELGYHRRISKMATLGPAAAFMSLPAACCGATRRCTVSTQSVG